MWSWLFGKKVPAPRGAAFGKTELHFRDGKAALEYISKFMKTEWRPKSIITALSGPMRFTNGILVLSALAPQGDIFEEVTTMTTIRAVSTPTAGRVPVSERTTLADLGLNEGDLVAVLLAERAPPKLQQISNWIAFVVGRLEPTYDSVAGGWKMTHRYEL